ncbi:MAG: UDP-glucose 4-epimerase GalE [Ignavibacteria bacterium]|nr:UDP-glucose 4-epimerase GalE [Ignavibacteria bacterium]
MKILVTGGAGYIGSHTVVELMNAGYEVVIIDNFSNSDASALGGIEQITGKAPVFYNIDLCDKEDLNYCLEKEKDVNAIIHFAAFKAVGESERLPMKYYNNNVVGMVNLLDCIIKNNLNNFVFSSSCTVYGDADELPVTENSPMKKAESAYGFTKQIGERMLSDVSKSDNLRVISLRYFNPIGAHDTALIGELPIGVPNNLVPFITQTAIGLREQLTVFGNDYDTPDGTNIRDYIHVVDLAKAHVKAVERLINKKAEDNLEIFNLGTGVGNSVLEVVNTFEKVTGQKLNYKIGARRAGDVVSIYADTKKAGEVLGWKTERDLANSLSTVWKWELALKERREISGETENSN